VGIRISPHFYNTADEIERTVAEIRSIVDTRDYAADAVRSVVT
jgi:selenocysteine lyase/cysteine desulfurase